MLQITIVLIRNCTSLVIKSPIIDIENDGQL